MRRRKFLQLAALSGMAGLLPESALAADPVVRREWSKATTEVNAYADFIAYAKNLPASNPANWTNLAEIHNRMCSHSNWFFFPWHRPYLGYLEYLIRQHSGNPGFALPYWNWTAEPTIPKEFGSGPLLDPRRKRKPGDVIPRGFTDGNTMLNVMNTPSFNLFAGKETNDQFLHAGYGAVEATPHNAIHNWLSGDMGNFMSPLDPLFWMHHCNIDRLWNVWTARNRNTTNAVWLGYRLQYGPFTFNVRDTLTTQKMGYIYDRPNNV